MKYNNKKLRHELKYYINYFEYTGLQKRLKSVMTQDSFGIYDGSYHIRSLYFDDMYDSALYDKNFGIFKRQKYRIRIYNNSDATIKLERKSKYGQYTSKESSLLTIAEYKKIMNKDIDFLRHSSDPIKLDFYLQVKSRVLRPKVVVDYEREAFILKTSDVRITFDKNLQAGLNSVDIFDENLVTVNAFKKPIMILEIKYNEFLPENIRNLLQISSCENTAISKYVICRVQKNNI